GERAVVIVAIENAGSAVAGDKDVGPAVFVEVERGDAEAVVAVGFVDVSGLGDVLEGAVAAIVIKEIRAPRQAARAAHHRDAFPDAIGTLAGLGSGGE